MGADVSLRCGPIELGINPDLGGCCTRLIYQRNDRFAPADVLRPLPADSHDPFEAACFAMLPYSNRLLDGQLWMHSGDKLEIAKNCSRVEFPIHGVGWMHAWDVALVDADKVHMTYHHAADRYWPFAMDCTQTMTLTPDGVQVEASVRNLARTPMPAGLGFHPRFHLSPDATVTLGAKTVWQQDDRGYPMTRVSVHDQARFDYCAPTAGETIAMNHCFADWCGMASISRPLDQFSVRLTASANLRHLVVYRLAGAGWLCMEPVSHATGALSLESLQSNGNGAHMVSPGECLVASMAIQLFDDSLNPEHKKETP